MQDMAGLTVIPTVELKNMISQLLDEKLSSLPLKAAPAVDDNPWLTIPQFCNRYQRGRSTVERQIKEGKLEVLDDTEYIKKIRRRVFA